MIKKPRTISIRLTEEQYQIIQEMIKFIESQTGTKVTQSSLILKLIEFGKPILEQLYPHRQVALTATLEQGTELKKGFFRLFR